MKSLELRKLGMVRIKNVCEIIVSQFYAKNVQRGSLWFIMKHKYLDSSIHRGTAVLKKTIRWIGKRRQKKQVEFDWDNFFKILGVHKNTNPSTIFIHFQYLLISIAFWGYVLRKLQKWWNIKSYPAINWSCVPSAILVK